MNLNKIEKDLIDHSTKLKGYLNDKKLYIPKNFKNDLIKMLEKLDQYLDGIIDKKSTNSKLDLQDE